MTRIAVALLGLASFAAAASTTRFQASVADPVPVGSAYEALSAQEKLDLVWGLCTKSTTPANWMNPLVSNARLLLIDMNPTMDFVGDEIPKGRAKLIHQTGSVAQIEWTAGENTPYTGLFKGGKGILRWGFATKPDPKAAGGPLGFGLKLFRDGMPSGNFVMLYTLADWDSWNPLKYPYSNVLTKPSGAALGAVQKKFETASKWALGVGLSEFASFDASGAKISEAAFPFRLAFVPNRTIRSRLSDSYADFATTVKENFPAGTVLFDIYAYDAPNSKPVWIGSVKSLTTFTTTSYEKIFFKHTRLEEDVAMRPELESYFIENETEALPNLPAVETFPAVRAL